MFYKTDYHCKIKETLFIQELEPALNYVLVPSSAVLYINSCFKCQRSLLKIYVEYIRKSSHNQNEQVQNVYDCCLCVIFDQTTMAQEQKYLQ